MQLSEIFSKIFAGDTIRIRFSTRREMESFRVALFAFKKKEESTLTSIGYGIDKMVLSVNWKPVDSTQSEGAGVVTLKLKPPRVPVSYEVVQDLDEAAP